MLEEQTQELRTQLAATLEQVERLRKRLPSSPEAEWLVEQVGPLVRTTFDPGDVLRLARTALAVEASEIRSEVLLPCGGDEPHCELIEENTPAGYYLIPDVDKVRALVADLFSQAAGSSLP